MDTTAQTAKAPILTFTRRPDSWLVRLFDYKPFLVAICMLPTVGLLVVFLTYPLGLGIWLAFTDATIGNPGEFIGLENFISLWDDPVFWLSVGNTFFYTAITTVIKFALGLWLALPKHLTQRIEAKHRAAAVLARLKQSLNRLLRSHRLAAPFGVGLLNGWLPCGFVYLALAGALAQPNVTRSILFMTLFGLGTMPAMLAIMLPNGLLSPARRISLRRVMPVGTAVVAVLLIVRGLGLGVPYLSPMLASSPGAQTAAPACHPH